MEKKTYDVLVREIHVAHFLVEADSPEAAIMAVREGEGDHTYTEYSSTCDDETWTVEEE